MSIKGAAVTFKGTASINNSIPDKVTVKLLGRRRRRCRDLLLSQPFMFPSMFPPLRVLLSRPFEISFLLLLRSTLLTTSSSPLLRFHVPTPYHLFALTMLDDPDSVGPSRSVLTDQRQFPLANDRVDAVPLCRTRTRPGLDVVRVEGQGPDGQAEPAADDFDQRSDRRAVTVGDVALGAQLDAADPGIVACISNDNVKHQW